MQEVYAGAFEVSVGCAPVMLEAERVLAPDDVRLPGGGVVWRGARLHGPCRPRPPGLGLPAARVLSGLLPGAGDVARIAVEMLLAGRALVPEQALPVYLRNDVAGVSRGPSG